MSLPATLDISLDFSSGATFGIGLTLDDPVNGLLDTGILAESTTPSADITLEYKGCSSTSQSSIAFWIADSAVSSS